MSDYVAYYRVSTTRQGHSGLGLESQRESVAQYLRSTEGNLINDFVEIESGKKYNRPQLLAAIKECKSRKAILIIAKLDRLARNVHFISGLMESKVEFVAVDNPHANRLMLHLLAAFAEHEREQISQRTKEAMQAARRRGVRLGVNGHRLAEQNKSRAREFAQSLKSVIQDIQEDGLTLLQDIADELNNRNIQTARGGIWYPTSVARVMKYLD